MAKLDAESKHFLEAATAKYETNLELVSPYLQARGIGLDAARQYRLGSVSEAEPGHEKTWGRLSIPYITPSGIVAIKFRCVRDHDCKESEHPKYLAPKGQKPRLYNVAAFTADGDYIGITEGELDALVLSRYCGIPASGVPGSDNWGQYPHWARMFSGFRTVLVFAHPDPAGGRLTGRIVDSLAQARVVELPGDVNETFLSEGADYVRQVAGLR